MSKKASAIKILLADDHEIFRDGFAVMIKKQPDIDLIGEAGDGEELLNKVRQLKPDVVVTDIKMPRMDGIEVMHHLQKEYPQMGVIALTNYNEDNLIVEMLEAGAKGYLLKSANKEEIIEAIKTVFGDRTHYCRETNMRLVKLIADSQFNPYRKKKKVELNQREIDIMKLICQGKTNKEMALELFLSQRTIETHRENIMHKTGESSVAGLVIFAIKHGIYKIN